MHDDTDRESNQSLARKIFNARAASDQRYDGAADTMDGLIEEMNSAGYQIRRNSPTKVTILRQPGERWAFLRRLFSHTVFIKAVRPDELVVRAHSARGEYHLFEGSRVEVASYLARIAPR